MMTRQLSHCGVIPFAARVDNRLGDDGVAVSIEEVSIQSNTATVNVRLINPTTTTKGVVAVAINALVIK